MADLKISQLTGATTPLAGTEVLPIVQSGSTRQVSVANLTAGRTQTSNGIVQGTAGTGYNFTANTPAAGMTSQLLNWYEEGTWTPTVDGSSTAGTGTYSAQNGSYTRIGNRVMFTAYIAWSAHTGTGNMRVNGLPFAAANNANNYGAVAIYMDAATALSAGNVLQMRTILGSTGLFPTQAPTGGGAASQVPLPSSGGFMLTGHYYV